MGEKRVRLLPLLAILGFLALPGLLLANGGTLRVADAPVGAYRVSVYTDPTPPRPDSVDVSVLVVREGDPTPVPDLEIAVRATPVEEPGDEREDEGGDESADESRGAPASTRTVAATRDQADDPRYYAAKFAPGRVGPWRFEVDVRGPEGEGTVSFEIQVREPGLLDRPWVVVGLALVPLALLASWLLRGGTGEADEAPSARNRNRPGVG